MKENNQSLERAAEAATGALQELHEKLGALMPLIGALRKACRQDALEEEENPDLPLISIVAVDRYVKFEWSKLTRLFVVARLGNPPSGETGERRRWLAIMRALGGDHWATLPGRLDSLELMDAVPAQCLVEQVPELIKFLERTLEWGAKKRPAKAKREEAEDGEGNGEEETQMKAQEFAVLDAFLARLEASWEERKK